MFQPLLVELLLFHPVLKVVSSVTRKGIALRAIILICGTPAPYRCKCSAYVCQDQDRALAFLCGLCLHEGFPLLLGKYLTQESECPVLGQVGDTALDTAGHLPAHLIQRFDRAVV